MAGVGFGLGVASIAALSGCCNSNWGGGNVNINASRYNTINGANIRSGRATQLPANASNWRHDPSHRGGVAYRDPGSRQAYQRGARPAAATRDFRGYSGSHRGAVRAPGAVGQGTSRPPAAAANRAPRAAGRRGGCAPTRRPQYRRGGPCTAERAEPGASQGTGYRLEVRGHTESRSGVHSILPRARLCHVALCCAVREAGKRPAAAARRRHRLIDAEVGRSGKRSEVVMANASEGRSLLHLLAGAL